MSPSRSQTGQPSASETLRNFSPEQRLLIAERDLTNLPGEHESAMSGLLDAYERHVDAQRKTPRYESFMPMAEGYSDCIAEQVHTVHEAAGSIFRMRTEANLDLAGPDTVKLASLVETAKKHGVSHYSTGAALRGVDYSLRDAAEAVIEEMAFKDAIAIAKKKGVGHYTVSETLSVMGYHARRAADAALDDIRFEQAKTVAAHKVQGPNHHRVKEIFNSASYTSYRSMDATLDGLRCKFAAKLASKHGPDSYVTRNMISGVSNYNAQRLITEIARQRPKADKLGAGATAAAFEAPMPRRRPRKAVALVAAASLALGAGLASTGVFSGEDRPSVAARPFDVPTPDASPSASVSTEVSPTAIPTPDVEVERSDTGLCISREASALLASDCNVLDRVDDGATFKLATLSTDEYGVETIKGDRYIGSYVNGVEEFSLLSPQYQEALRIALTDPIVAVVQKRVPIVIEQDPRVRKENGWHRIESDGQESVKLIFTTDTSVPRDEMLYQTWGTIRDTLVHEDAHVLFNGWQDRAETDKFYSSRVDEMAGLCRSEMRTVVGQYYDQGGRETMMGRLKGMQKIVKDLRAHKQMSRAQALKAKQGIEKVKSVISTRSGYLNAMVTNSGPYDCETGDVTELIYKYTDMQMDEFFDTTTQKGADQFDYLYSFKRAQLKFQMGATGYMREGVQLKGIDGKNSGHPFDTTEQVASALTSLQLNPEGYVQGVLALSPDRRQDRIRFTELIYELVQREDPVLAGKTNLVPVLKALRQGTR